MILSDKCYIKDRCWKYNNMSMECQKSPTYCPKLFKIDYLYNEALLSDRQRTHTPLRIDDDGTDREQFRQLKFIEDNIEEFVSSGHHLYLHSQGCGNGKTEWSIRLMQAYVGRIWHKSDLTCKVLFVHVPRYLVELKNSFSEKSDYVDHIKSCILKADLVVFDEIATKAGTQFELEILLSLINTRIDMGKSNVYTSNVSGQDLKEKIGDRLYSRIVNMSTNVELFGKDKRSLVG